MNTTNRVREEAGKDPEELQREIEEQRAKVGDTLDVLQERLRPRQLLDQARDTLRERARTTARNLGGSILERPLPMVLAGIGLALLLVPRRGSPNPYRIYAERDSRRFARRMTAAAGTATAAGPARDAQARIAAATARIMEAREALADEATALASHASEVAHHARQRTRHFGEGFAGTIERKPVAATAMGMVFSALATAAVPIVRQFLTQRLSHHGETGYDEPRQTAVRRDDVL